MRRREFILLLGGAAVSSAAAQQSNKKRLVGIITGFNDKETMSAFAAFRARMQELGWIEGQNIAFDVRNTSGDYAKLDTEAGSLVAASADVIVAQGTAGLTAARKYTKTIPVVFNQVSDPVGQRLIDSLAHPGGNITGLTNFEFVSGSKWIELLLELDSKVSHVTLITNPANENTAQFVKAVTAAGDTKKVAVRVASVRDPADIQDAIENYSKRSGGGLIIFPDGFLINHRELIVELAARYRMPAVYPFRVFPEVGGLVSYGPNLTAIFRRTAEYVDKILNGTRPADLPDAGAAGQCRRGHRIASVSRSAECLLLAQSGHHNCAEPCQLLGVKRTWRIYEYTPQSYCPCGPRLCVYMSRMTSHAAMIVPSAPSAPTIMPRIN
jgi:putative tryptophan/tyrosine transport system substrate-binding protein